MPIQPKTHTGTSRKNTVSLPETAAPAAQQETGKLITDASANQPLMAVLTEASTPAQPSEHSAVTNEATEPIDSERPTETINTTQHATNEPDTAAPETGLVTQFPELHLSVSELTFVKTPVGKPIFMVFTIAQQNATTPVTITSDEPTHFQVASDSRPAFKPMLTLTPSPTGTFVHVRFAPVKAGQIDGHLIIETPYTTKFLAITGRGTGLMSTVRAAPAVGQPQLRPPTRSRSLIGGLALTTLLVAGLSMAGYTFRCQLMPSLCNEVADSAVAPAEPVNAPAPAPVTESTNNTLPARQRRTTPVAIAKPLAGERRRSKSETTDESIVNEETGPITTDEPAGDTPVKKQTADKVEEPAGSSATSVTPAAPLAQKPAVKPADAPQPKVVQPEKPVEPVVSPNGESDLERELNTKKPKNQQ